LFAKYCSGELKRLPWCDSPLSPESDSIKDHLVKINRDGFLTINSQPATNGAPSTDEKQGWGPKGGFVYQKVISAEFIRSQMTGLH
jgi:methylenetetrahydrofolate reductase (NADPH)